MFIVKNRKHQGNNSPYDGESPCAPYLERKNVLTCTYHFENGLSKKNKIKTDKVEAMREYKRGKALEHLADIKEDK